MKIRNILIVIVVIVLAFVGYQFATNKEDAVETGKPVADAQENEADDVSSASDKETEVKPIVFEEIPEKVVAGTIGVTEMFDILEVDLVGVPSSESYTTPERYRDLPTVGMSMQPDAEIVKSLDADLFVSVTSLQASLEESLGSKSINTLFIEANGYDDIAMSIKLLGDAFDKKEQAAKFLNNMEETEAKVLNSIEGKEKKKAMVIFGTPESFMLATDMSYIGDLVNRLGVDNVTDEMEAKGPYVPFSIENVVASNPDVIIRFTHADPETSKKMFEKEFAENPTWNALDSVKAGKVYDLDPHYFGVVANVRCAEALEKLAEIIYGE